MSLPAADTSQEKPILSVSGLGKTYRIFRSPKDRLKQALLDGLARRGLIKRPSRLYSEKVALTDINFDLRRGEALGIIGKNGAGKSTLLQLIAGTLKPTEGSMQLDGTVTSLLELGTGFAPGFTGRENIFIAGQINGHSKAEMEVLEHDVIAFADIGEYIDQPVRTYSSGMMMRLAFAVQTAVKPDLLIVDEAMAVGDISFQAKCMDRMLWLRKQGTAIIFVSHSMSTVSEVCKNALLLDAGKQLCVGCVDYAVNEYHRLLQGGAAIDASRDRSIDGDQLPATEDAREHLNFSDDDFQKNAAYQRIGNGKAKVLNALLLSETGNQQEKFDYGERATLRIIFDVADNVDCIAVAYKIKTVTGTHIIYADTGLYELLDFKFEKGSKYQVDWTFELNLTHGAYVLAVSLGTPTPKIGVRRSWEQLDNIPLCKTFEVNPRATGMVGSTAVWNNDVTINRVSGVSGASE